MLLLKSLLLNLLAIFVVLFFAFLFIQKKFYFFLKNYRFYIFLASSILIVISHLLTLRTNDCIFYDLRFVPFVIGGLYGQAKVTIGLALISIICRIPFGTDGLWFSILEIFFLSVLVIFLCRHFVQKSSMWRLGITTFIACVYTFILHILSFVFEGIHYHHLMIFSVVLIISTYIVCYINEVLKNTIFIKLKEVHNKQMNTNTLFTASIIHEVKNQLAAAKGFLQLLLENKHLTDKVKSYTTHALEEISQAMEIVESYLSLEKSHTDNPILFDINDEIVTCSKIIEPFAINNHVTIETNLKHIGLIRGIPSKFRQALINIGKNGIEAMPDGGTLTFNSYNKEDQIIVEIKDTGIGMTKEQISQICKPYYSVKKEKGTGLGMMVVLQIVKSMNGKLEIKSTPNKGTSVYMSFPIGNEE